MEIMSQLKQRERQQKINGKQSQMNRDLISFVLSHRKVERQQKVVVAEYQHWVPLLQHLESQNILLDLQNGRVILENYVKRTKRVQQLIRFPSSKFSFLEFYLQASTASSSLRKSTFAVKIPLSSELLFCTPVHPRLLE